MDKINLAAGRKPSSAPQINSSLKAVYALLGAGNEDRFAITSSGAAAMRELLFAHYLDFIRQTGRTHLLTLPTLSSAEEFALAELEQLGVVRKPLPLNAKGQLTRAALEEAVRARSSLLTLPWVDPLTGVVQPVHDLAEVCRNHDIRLHLDLSAALGKLFFRSCDLGADFLSFDSPSYSSGGLLVRAGIPFFRLEEPREEPLAALVGELDHLMQQFDHFSTETARLRSRFESALEERIEGAQPLLRDAERVPNIALIAFPGAHSEALLLLLQKRGLLASNGGGYFAKLETKLISYGIDACVAKTALSFTLSSETTEEMVDRAIEWIVESVGKLQQISKEVLCS